MVSWPEIAIWVSCRSSFLVSLRDQSIVDTDAAREAFVLAQELHVISEHVPDLVEAKDVEGASVASTPRRRTLADLGKGQVGLIKLSHKP